MIGQLKEGTVALAGDDRKQPAHLVLGEKGDLRWGRSVRAWLHASDSLPVLSEKGHRREDAYRRTRLQEPGPRLSYCRIVAAQAATGWTWDRKPGYHVRNVSSHSPFNTRVRICSRRWAPRGLHCICGFFTMRLLMTWFTVDSTKPVLMRSPLR